MTVPDVQAVPGARSRARFEVPEELRADVRLLGELLGRVLVEYAGQPLLDDVERLRELTIARDGSGAEELVASWPHERAEDVARAFTCYFHLTNLAEELHRGRVLRERDRTGDAPSTAPSTSELAQAVADVRSSAGEPQMRALLAGLEFRPVLTAHPTEARRRAVLATIRRISSLLQERGDPRAGDTERAENTPAAAGAGGRAVADLAATHQPADAAGRGSVRDGRLLRDAVRGRRQRVPPAGRRAAR